jgi:clan AA aspartic protease
MASGSASRVTSVPTTKAWTHREMGQVVADIEIVNAGDHEVANRGLMEEAAVRRVALSSVLVDTGATHLCLPADVVERLGLPLLREDPVETATGAFVLRVFEGARVTIGGRTDTFSAVELPAGREPLLGVVVMESLGLRPDLRSHALEFLPAEPGDTYMKALELRP